MARAPAVQEIEAAPEADRLDGFPHPRETRTLFGHADAERAFTQALAAGRPHHGWMIGGREGIGKATLAYRAARFLLAEPGERDSEAWSLGVGENTAAARQVRAQSHPGLLVIRRLWDPQRKRFGVSIPVDEVRKLRSFLAHTADAEAWRVVIVDTADELNANAANALLKSLEEPPSRTVFLLLTSEPGRLLPTIRSRCRTLPLTPLSGGDLRQAAAAALQAADGRDIGGDVLARLEPLADGSVRRLLELAANDGAALHDRIEAIFSRLPKIDWAAAHVLADDLASPASEQRFQTFFALLLGVLARSIRAGISGQGHGAEGAFAARVIAPARPEMWAQTWEAIVREKAEVQELNLDRRALVLGTLSRLAATAAP
jgi:DNA polymerase III subunit delta'